MSTPRPLSALRRKPFHPRPIESRLHCESLEGRIVLTAGISLDATTGILRIMGSETADVSVVRNDGFNVVATMSSASGTTTRSYKSSEVKAMTFAGYAGDDFFTNNTAIPSTASGGAGKDTLRGGSGKDTLMGGDGDDKLMGNKGDDTLQGAAGNDTEIGGAGIDTLYGGLGDDSLSGAAGDDTLNGGSGDDWLEGGAGNDSASGDDGNDVQYGGTGNDSMKGGNGHDLLYGDDGIDTVEGEAGDDRLDGGSGDDSLRGGIGDDTSVDAEDNLDDVEGTEQEDSDDQRHGTAVTAVGVSFDAAGSAQITGSLADKRDRQYFTFQAAADGHLSIELLPGGNGGWAKLSLYDANGREVIELNPSSRSRSTATVAVVAGTTYTLRLRTPGKSAVDFTVNLKLA
ncbi:MAG: calcium-binding protein [Planctomycetota bacterium]|nr:calcium-binding protein [Planctomycetota bacterium]